MWENYTLLPAAVINSSNGGYELNTGQQTQPGPPHRESQFPCLISISEERASKKPKTVDNETLARVNIAWVRVLESHVSIFHLVLLPYDVGL